LEALRGICPDMEIFSVDEAFLDATCCQRLHGTPVRIARLAQRRVWEVSGLHCSVEVCGDKTTAKFAAKLRKPNSFTVIPPWEVRARLADVPTTELAASPTASAPFSPATVCGAAAVSNYWYGDAAAARRAHCRSAAGHPWNRSKPAGGIAGNRDRCGYRFAPSWKRTFRETATGSSYIVGSGCRGWSRVMAGNSVSMS